MYKKLTVLALVLVLAGSLIGQTADPGRMPRWDRFKDYLFNCTGTFTYKTFTSPIITGASLSGTSAFTGPITLSSTFTQTYTSAATSGTIRSMVINQTHTGDGAAILEALRVNIASAVQTGSWANAIVGRIAYSGATGDAGGGLAAAMCSEVVLPAISSPAGSYFAHDFEFEAPTSYVANTGDAFNVAFLRFGVYGTTVASFEDEAYFMHISTDFTDASGNMWFDNTLRIQIETTDWYIPLSDAEGEFSTAYLIDVSNATDASSLTAASIATDGGLAVAKQLFLGDDLDMSVSGTGVYDITLKTNVADALSITDGTDIIVFKTSATRSVVITPNTDVVGDFTAGTVTSDAGVSGTTGTFSDLLTATGGIAIGNAATGITIAGGGSSIPMIIGTKSNTADAGLILVGGSDDTGGIQVFCDDGGDAAAQITSPIWTRYLLTVAQSSGATQTGAYLQLKTEGSLTFTTGSITATKIFNQGGTVTLASGAEYGIVNAGMTLAGAATIPAGTMFTGIDINIGGVGPVNVTSTGIGAGLIIRSKGEGAKWHTGIFIPTGAATTGIQIGTSAAPSVQLYTDGAMAIYTTCASTSGTSYEPVLFYTTLTGEGQTGGRVRAFMTTNIALGGWSNALKAEVTYGAAGRTTGLGSALCAEMTMAAGTTSGTYAPIEIELNMGTTGVTGTQTSLIFMSVNGTSVTEFNDLGYLFALNGLTAGTSGSDVFETSASIGAADEITAGLRIAIDGVEYYLLMCTPADIQD